MASDRELATRTGIHLEIVLLGLCYRHVRGNDESEDR